jgi:NUDIX domain
MLFDASLYTPAVDPDSSPELSLALDKPEPALLYWNEQIDCPLSSTAIPYHRLLHTQGLAMAPLLKRKRATAILEYPDGILLTLMRYMAASLPGGGVKPGESDEAAVIRELHEETRLHAIHSVFLFRQYLTGK